MTRNDIIRRALMRLGVVAHDEPMTAEQQAEGGAIFDTLAAEIGQERGLVEINPEVVPDASQAAMINFLAVDLAPIYGVAPPDTRARAWVRLAATLRADDRDDTSEPAVYY